MIDKHNFINSAPEIGIGVAETDALKFPTSFIKLKTYTLISREDIVYIAGRKGSGKSAICIEYENSEETAYHSILSMKKDSLDYVKFREVRTKLIAKKISDEDVVYIARDAWFLSIKINLMIEICLSNIFSIDSRIRIIKEYLNDQGWYDFKGMKRAMAFVSKIITVITGEKAAGDINTAISEFIDTDPKTIEAMRALTSWLDDLEKPILFMIDDIDSEVAVPQTEAERLHAVSYCDALVNATQSLSYPSLSKNFHLKVFIPQDLFSQVHQRHMDKTPGAKVTVKWTSEQLLNLVVARLWENLPPLQKRKWSVEKNTKDIWIYYMPEKIFMIDSRLRKPYPFDSHKILQSFTLQRPRDLVQLCDKIFRKCYENNQPLVDEAVIWDCISEYSDELIVSIINEYSTVRVDIKEIIQTFANYKRFYKKDEMVTHLVKQTQIGNQEDANQWIDILYDAGFLGVLSYLDERSPVPSRPDKKEEYYYDRDRVNVHNSPDFCIHRAFGKSLNLTMDMGIR